MSLLGRETGEAAIPLSSTRSRPCWSVGRRPPGGIDDAGECCEVPHRCPPVGTTEQLATGGAVKMEAGLDQSCRSLVRLYTIVFHHLNVPVNAWPLD